MKLRAFTLIEMLITIIIAGVLATLAITQYQGFIENADAQVCETKQKAVATFINNYAMEHDTMPADYSSLPQEGIDKAYASILKQKGAWKIKMAFFVVGLRNNGIAYAANQQALRDIVKGDSSLLVCPRNKTGGISYGINQAIRGMSSKDYRQLPDNFLIIGDCDAAHFTNAGELAGRHRNYSGSSSYGYPQGVTKGGQSIVDIAKKINSVPNMNDKISSVLSGSGSHIIFCKD